MNTAVLILQIIIGIVLSVLILLQAKGTGLGRSFSGMAYHSRRGFEKIIFKTTIVLSVLFVIASLATHIIA